MVLSQVAKAVWRSEEEFMRSESCVIAAVVHIDELSRYTARTIADVVSWQHSCAIPCLPREF